MTTVRQVADGIQGSQFALEARTKLTVMDVLHNHFANVKINKALSMRIYRFQIGYVNTSPDYIEFFGSNLLGVHVIRFREVDVLRFFNDVLEIEYKELESDIRACDTIEHSRKISSDIFNLTLIYLIHRALNERTLSDSERMKIAKNTALIFFYRSMAALLSAYFHYPADPKIAQAAYANLSYKFLIKKLGSWHQVMDYRADELISKSGIYHSRIYKLQGGDDDLVKLINGAANQIKDMILNYYSEFAKVHAQGDRIGVTSTTGMDAQGLEVVKDRIRNIDKYIAQAKLYVSDQGALVRDDWIRVISDINRNTSPRLLKETLLWISGHANGKEHKLIDEAVTNIVIYSFFLIESRIEPSRTKDISYVLLQLKNLYLSSRSTDPDLLKIREQTDQLLLKAHKELSDALLLATRTALILYITFRVLIGQRST